jgi:HSP20 family molecular chaperone IbpA
MIYVRPTSPHTFHPACDDQRACQRPQVHKVFFTTCNSDEIKSQSQENVQPSSDEGRVFVERAPIHFEDTCEFAKLALDVAGFSPDDIQVRMEDFIVSINGKRTNKLGDTYMISRRFRVDRKTAVEEDVRASLTDGILEILVPKKAKAGPRSIPISTTRPMLETLTDVTTEGSKEPNEESNEKDATIEDKTEEQATSVNVETVKEDDNDKEPESIKTKTVTEEESWEEVKE